MQRPHPGGLARSPAHRLGPGELARATAGTTSAMISLRGAARLVDAGDVVVALLLVLDDLGVLDRCEARRLEEARHRLLRRADARALALLADVGRLRRHVLDHQRQPARRGVGLGLADAETLRLQAFGDETLQVFGRARLHARRDLFGKQLEEQLSHGGNHRSFRDRTGRAEPVTEAPPAKRLFLRIQTRPRAELVEARLGGQARPSTGSGRVLFAVPGSRLRAALRPG